MNQFILWHNAEDLASVPRWMLLLHMLTRDCRDIVDMWVIQSFTVSLKKYNITSFESM